MLATVNSLAEPFSRSTLSHPETNEVYRKRMEQATLDPCPAESDMCVYSPYLVGDGGRVQTITRKSKRVSPRGIETTTSSAFPTLLNRSGCLCFHCLAVHGPSSSTSVPSTLLKGGKLSHLYWHTEGSRATPAGNSTNRSRTRIDPTSPRHRGFRPSEAGDATSRRSAFGQKR